jgi:hypothetical protein
VTTGAAADDGSERDGDGVTVITTVTSPESIGVSARFQAALAVDERQPHREAMG